MRAWGAERSIRAGTLRHLLVAEHGHVHAKGVRLQGVRISGQLDLESATLRCPLHLEYCYLDNDGPVVLDYATASVFVLTDCHVAGLKADTLVVTRTLDLAGTTFTRPVWLAGADITGHLTLRCAHLTADEEGDALVALRIKVGGDVLLNSAPGRGPFTAAGAVRLADADIKGKLSLRGAQLTVAGKDGLALDANGLKAHNILMDSAAGWGAFTAAGAVRLDGADITGFLFLRGAHLAANKKGDALLANALRAGSVFLDPAPGEGAFTAAGAVWLQGADITGQLILSGAQLTMAGKNGIALNATGLKAQNVVMEPVPGEGAFTAAGAVWLDGADITGFLFLRGAHLAADKNRIALNATGLKANNVLMNSVPGEGAFTAAGTARPADAQARGSLTGADLTAKSGKTALPGFADPVVDSTGQPRFRSAELIAAGDALVANGLKAGGDVFLDPALARAPSPPQARSGSLTLEWAVRFT